MEGQIVDRDEGGKFLPGSRANPGGRPKLPEDVKARLKSLTGPAVEVLNRCLQSKDEKIQLEAAKHILDRVYGKPAQSTELKLEGFNMAAMHLQVLVEAAERRKALRAQQAQQPGDEAVLIGQGGQA